MASQICIFKGTSDELNKLRKTMVKLQKQFPDLVYDLEMYVMIHKFAACLTETNCSEIDITFLISGSEQSVQSVEAELEKN